MRMFHRGFTPAVLAVLAAFAACGEGAPVEGEGDDGAEGEGDEDSGEGEGEGEGETADDPRIDALLGALETAVAECEDFAGPFARLEPASAGVAADLDEARAGLVELFVDPDTDVDDAAVAACIEGLGSCSFTVSSNDNPCARIVVGNHGDGEACNADECAPGLACFQPQEGCGICQPLPGDGESCDGDPDPAVVTSTACAAGFGCVFDGNGLAVCQPLIAAGQPCNELDGADCVNGFDCRSDDEGGDGTCEAIDTDGPEGDPCDEAEAFSCGFFTGLTCVEGACAPQQPVAPGEVCDDGLRYCVNQLSRLNFCFDADNDGESICTPLPGAGEACIDGANCRADSVCDGANCVALPGVGEACIDVTCAEGLSCDDGNVCVAPAGLGDSCVVVDCAEDLFCDEDGVCSDGDDEPICRG